MGECGVEPFEKMAQSKPRTDVPGYMDVIWKVRSILTSVRVDV